jgi:hypothetical protein
MTKKRLANENPPSGALTPETSLRCAPWRDVQVVGAWVHGEEATARAFNPFDAYLGWEEHRDAALPVHQKFANLTGEDRDAETRTFLETYGPLHNGQVDRQGRLAASLDNFWTEHDLFDFPYQLVEVQRNGRDSKRLRGTLREAVKSGEGQILTSESLLSRLQDVFGLHIRTHAGNADAGARAYAEVVRAELLRQIRHNSPSELLKNGERFLTRVIGDRLARVHPLLAFEPESNAPLSRFATWSCSTLGEAIWMMLFLDITFDRRIVRCRHCGTFFADAKENVRFCSDRCEKRSRNLRWWREHGNKWRAGRPKPRRPLRRR